jgi:hypothetical protein
MRVLICGSRDWTNKALIEAWFDWLEDKKPVTIVHGDCPTGADRIAARLAVQYGYSVEAHPPERSKYPGNSAYYIRNKAMVDSGVDMVIAFLKNNSKGTNMTIDLARAVGIKPVVVED